MEICINDRNVLAGNRFRQNMPMLRFADDGLLLAQVLEEMQEMNACPSRIGDVRESHEWQREWDGWYFENGILHKHERQYVSSEELTEVMPHIVGPIE